MTIESVVSKVLTSVRKSAVSDALRSGSLSRHIAGVYDPVLETEAGGFDATYTLTVVFGEAPNADKYKNYGVIIEPTDVESFLFELSVAPNTNDKVIYNGTTYSVVFVTDSSAGAGSGYTVVLRKTNG